MAINLSYEYFESIDSTNDEIKRRLTADGETADVEVKADEAWAAAPPEGLVISAGTQTAGRGRSGHSWSSPAGTSIATSLLLRPSGLSPELLPQLTIVSAAAVAMAIEDFARDKGVSVSGAAGSPNDGDSTPVAIKWPNDILLHGKKVSGILVERLILADGAAAVIIGIGVNLREGAYPPGLSDRATSVYESLGIDIDGQAVACGIWERFRGLYDDFVFAGGLSPVTDYYNSRLYNRGRWVRVLDPVGEYVGTAGETDGSGRLLVRREDGKVESIDSGEVSVRGIDGYV